MMKNIDELYEYIMKYASEKNMNQVRDALILSERCHRGQYRKGTEKIPYIIHPLRIARNCVALGLEDEIFIASALLHDVCEDCNIEPNELPVDDEIIRVVELLTKKKNKSKENLSDKEYYKRLSKNGVSLMLKIMDRWDNLSDMVGGFNDEKIIEYTNETIEHVYPLFNIGLRDFPDYEKQLYILRYQIESLINFVRRFLLN